MTPDPLDRIRSIRDIPALIAYLRDELDWPIEADDFDELTFDYEPEELGIDVHTAAKIEEIKQLRPLAGNQPWGIFFIRFEPKRLPVVVLRRILSQLVVRKRASASKSDLATWRLHDLLFISNYGEDDHRQITFAHFTQDTAVGDLPTLKVLGWDDADTALHISHVHRELKEKLHWPDNENDLDGWRERWSSAFTLRHRQVITTSKDLAIHLADLARRIRRRADQVLNVETERGPLRKLHRAFREALIHDLSEEDFADMYAQTIAYGLLAARVSRPMGIIAENVTDMVPVTNPFLREMLGTFLTIGGRKGKMDFDELGIQDVVDLLNSRDTHMEAILRDFGNRTRQEDPVIHFYELFLAEYDKKMKVKRGVFYTPQPVVSYIVRSVHELLQTEFGLPDGLADTTTWGEMAARYAKPESSLPSREISPKPSLPSREGSREGEPIPFKIPDGVSPDTPFVQILDIATGTATFLVEVIDVIHKTMTAKWRKEGRLDLEFVQLWNEYVPKHLLPRLYGYELMMAPYAIAHMKIGLKLYETGYRFGSDERAHVYLTNALEPPSKLAEQAAANLFEALGHEAQAVNAVKRDKRFTVVIGNPPYSNFGKLNKIPFILELLEDYKRGLDEKKLNLDDDYIKFVCLAHWIINISGVGIVGVITNNSYLDGLSHRRLRESLRESFTKILAVDLGGSVMRGEVGKGDENVFDIQQGVAIGIFCRIPSLAEHGNVEAGRIEGVREFKYQALALKNIPLARITSVAPYHFFVTKEHDLDAPYLKYPSYKEMFDVFGPGIKAERDGIAIHHDRHSLETVVGDFQHLCESELRMKYDVKDDSRDWKVSKAKADVIEHAKAAIITRIQYRPFDFRWTWYSGTTRGFIGTPGSRVAMQMLRRRNIGIITNRQIVSDQFSHILVSNLPTSHGIFYLGNKGQDYLAPLYLSDSGNGLQTSLGLAGNTRVNFTAAFLGQLSHALRLKRSGGDLPDGLTPEDIFHYMYAVFHSPTYRTRYAEFLKIDFPRLPLTSSIDLFRGLSRLGGELVALHLVEAPVQADISIRYDKTGGWIYAYTTPPPVRVAFTGPAEPVVDKVGWSDDSVWIDAVKPKKGAIDVKVTGTIGFCGVPKEVWDFHIGGYQVCEKWLKDRKGRTLGADDLAHYHRIVVALHETIRLMVEIDRVIAAHGGWPLK